MRSIRIASAANPFIAVLGTVLLVAMMLATMSLTAFERQWIVFLSGVLAAAVFAVVSHAANARWIIARRTSQLNATRSQLATQTRLRVSAEEALAGIRKNAQWVDEAMPAMLAYVDAGAIVRYHNHSYARWVGLEGRAIDGSPVHEILGRSTSDEVEVRLKEALAGAEVRYERTQTMANGEVFRLFVQYVPHFGADGKVEGVFAILTDITRAGDLVATGQPEEGQPAGVAIRLMAALERDEFCLYSQSIVPLGHAGEGADHCEVLLRLKEEEDNLLPPGAFLPIAEMHGLLPDIDRWVVRHVLDAAPPGCSAGDARYFLNVSPSTVAEGSFAAFVHDQLAAHRLEGAILCFEFPEQDVMASPRAYRDLISELGRDGCRFAVSGFGRNPALVRFFRQLRVNYLKVDAGIVLNMLRDPQGIARMKQINQAAHDAGMQVVAECVETDATRAALKGIGTDFGQGFGISLPRPMDPVQAPKAARAAEPERLAA